MKRGGGGGGGGKGKKTLIPKKPTPPSRKKKSSSPLDKLKKVKRKVTKGLKIAKAAGEVVGDVTNPYKMGKVIVGAAQGKGLVYPGSKYIGPFNPLNNGKPTSSADAAARRHDIAYDNYLKKGVPEKKLYLGFSTADQRLMDESDLTSKHGIVTYGGMAVKKGLYKLGLTGKKIR